jgi:hypothetical protein
MRFALGLCVFVSAASCGPARPDLDAIAEGYVRAALKLSQHDPSLVEQWRGPESWTPGPRRPVAEVQHEIEQLQEQIRARASDISSAVEHARVRYLSGQIAALGFAAARQLGRAASVDDQAREEFAVAFPALDRSAIARVHGKLERILPGTRPLAERVSALRKATTIPRERRLVVLSKAVEACRAATMKTIDLPRDESIDLVFKGRMSWDALARYEGQHRTRIEINDDSELDVSRALRLACHEGYPGHHVQHLLTDRLVGERDAAELLLTPGFGPHLLLAEGAAEVASDLALDQSERAALYRASLFPAAQLDPATIDQLVQVEELLIELLPVVTDVARQYLSHAVTEQAAVDRLANEALVANPRGTLSFIEQRRARALVYGEGRPIVYAAMSSRDLAALFDTFRRVAALQWSPR